MSKYLILIYDNEPEADALTGERNTEIMAGHDAFGTKYAAALRGGDALHRSTTATSVRPDGADGFSVTDGPFVETKEALGGYYVVEAADLDEAIAMAKEIPTIGGGSEIRPIRVFD